MRKVKIRHQMKYVKPLSLYQDVQKLYPSKLGRLIGLSIGADSFWADSVGVAISDPKNEVASPYCVMERKKGNVYTYMMASNFRDMIKKLSVSGIVVGLRKDPRGIRDTSRFNIHTGFPDAPDPSGNIEVKKFVDDLSEIGILELVPYTYWEEEDLLLKRREYMLFQSPGLSEEITDIKYAATRTLQRYLHAMNNYPVTEQESGHDSPGRMLNDLEM